MELKHENKAGFRGEVDIIPIWAWVVGVVVFIGMQWVFSAMLATRNDAPPPPVSILLGLLVGAAAACYVLLIGYITRDSRRRGMSPVLWTLIAILVPNAFGIVLYFILRHPTQTLCPKCRALVRAGFNFCPFCSHQFNPSCPECKLPVSAADVYCPHCGTPLKETVASGAARR